ncbi:MAG: hypothetical protein H0Z39_11295 [Peptococcaceae bacterium]|nr:hypothetical protein [Peptococcaceae bacterium]
MPNWYRRVLLDLWILIDKGLAGNYLFLLQLLTYYEEDVDNLKTKKE